MRHVCQSQAPLQHALKLWCTTNTVPPGCQGAVHWHDSCQGGSMHQSRPCSVPSAAMQTDCTSTNIMPAEINFNRAIAHLGIQSLDVLSRGCQLRRSVQEVRQSERLQRHSRWALHPRSSTLTLASRLCVVCKCGCTAELSSSLADGVLRKWSCRLAGRREALPW